MGELGIEDEFAVKVGLEVEPELGSCAEVAGEAEGGVGRDGMAGMNDVVDHMQFHGEAVRAEGKGLEEVFAGSITVSVGRETGSGYW